MLETDFYRASVTFCWDEKGEIQTRHIDPEDPACYYRIQEGIDHLCPHRKEITSVKARLYGFAHCENYCKWFVKHASNHPLWEGIHLSYNEEDGIVMEVDGDWWNENPAQKSALFTGLMSHTRSVVEKGECIGRKKLNYKLKQYDNNEDWFIFWVCGYLFMDSYHIRCVGANRAISWSTRHGQSFFSDVDLRKLNRGELITPALKTKTISRHTGSIYPKIGGTDTYVSGLKGELLAKYFNLNSNKYEEIYTAMPKDTTPWRLNKKDREKYAEELSKTLFAIIKEGVYK